MTLDSYPPVTERAEHWKKTICLQLNIGLQPVFLYLILGKGAESLWQLFLLLMSNVRKQAAIRACSPGIICCGLN